MYNTDPIRPMQTTLYIGETYRFIGRKPLIYQGRKNLMYNYSTCRTNRVLTRSVRRVRVYAFDAPTTRLRIWCTSEALTNQGGGASVYRLRSLLDTIDSHYHPNEHIILHVFRAPGSNSLVLLSQYEQSILKKVKKL